MTAKPENFYEYLQTLSSDSEIHAAQERYGRALDRLAGVEALMLELGAAATALRGLLQEGGESEVPAVVAYAYMLSCDAQLARSIADCALIKGGGQV